MNLIIPVGIVEFVFCSGRGLDEFRTEIIGEGRYALLTVPKGIWFNFRGRKKGLNIVANVEEVVHDAAKLLHRGAHDIDHGWAGL